MLLDTQINRELFNIKMDLIAVIWVKIKAQTHFLAFEFGSFGKISSTWPVCEPASGKTTQAKKLNLHCTTVEPAMSSHSYKQPTSYGMPLDHAQKWHFVYK